MDFLDQSLQTIVKHSAKSSLKVNKKLSLDQLSGIFYILSVGLGASVLVFLGEFVYFHIIEKRIEKFKKNQGRRRGFRRWWSLEIRWRLRSNEEFEYLE